MKRETEDLVRRVFEDRGGAPPPYQPNLSYEVIRSIACCPAWRLEKEALGKEGTVNQWIGKAVRRLCP